MTFCEIPKLVNVSESLGLVHACSIASWIAVPIRDLIIPLISTVPSPGGTRLAKIT